MTGSSSSSASKADPRLPGRRTLLLTALAAAGLATLAPLGTQAADLTVVNVTGLYSIRVSAIEKPTTTDAVAALVRTWPGQISVGGARHSMGGQIAMAGSLHLDMRAMKRVVWIRSDARLVRVQAGMTWRDLQEVLDPLGLAVETMQSYANFTVGGSISVNAHGRYVGHGAICHSLRALQIVMADGSVVEASRAANVELFRAAIGGYGAVGVVTEVELDLADNVRIERVVEEVPLERYVDHIERSVLANPASVLHNADLVPPAFDRPVSITWRATTKPLTDRQRLVAHGQGHSFEQDLIWLVTEMPGGERLEGEVVHPLILRAPVVRWLNREASLDAGELEPRTRRMSTYVLQEYFIPKRHFVAFARGIAGVLEAHRVEALNISLRHSKADDVSLLPWAREEVIAFVLYYKQRVHAAACEEVGRWTRELIDLSLACEGRYYLPYQLHATQAQFDRAYPEAAALAAVKARVDPSEKFTNALWSKYLRPHGRRDAVAPSTRAWIARPDPVTPMQEAT